jgi:hypothetical protein
MAASQEGLSFVEIVVKRWGFSEEPHLNYLNVPRRGPGMPDQLSIFRLSVMETTGLHFLIIEH